MNLNMERLRKWYLSEKPRIMAADDFEDNENPVGIHIYDYGWQVAINLSHTSVEEKDFPEVDEEKDPETDFYYCRVKNKWFYGWATENNFPKVIDIFLDWAEEKPV